MKPLISALLPLVMLTGTVAAQRSEQSYVGAVDGVAEPFAGEWAAFRPGGEDNTLVICAAPVTLTVLDTARLQYRLYSGDPLEYDLAAEDGRTAWSGVEPAIAVWIDPDEFQLTPVVGGVPTHEDVLVYHRCPENPRVSYAGSRDGLAAPFEGTWSMEMYSSTGNRPNQVIVGCDNPATLSATQETVVTYKPPGTDPFEVQVTAHDGHSDWRVADEPAPWEIVWIDEDRFHAYLIGIDRVTEWRLPYIFQRCPAG